MSSGTQHWSSGQPARSDTAPTGETRQVNHILYPLIPAMADVALDHVGIPQRPSATHNGPTDYDPIMVAHYALANWNAYCAQRDEAHLRIFLLQADWLVAGESRLADEVGVWPVLLATPNRSDTGYRLSALAQGLVLSVLTRASRVSDDTAYLDGAHRAARAFALDILDGGVSVPLRDDAMFFEEEAAYPASHALPGHVQGIIGLYDVTQIAHQDTIEPLIKRGLAGLCSVLDLYDTGDWTRANLLGVQLASRPRHAYHIQLLKALADYVLGVDDVRCRQCADVAERWARYERQVSPRLRRRLASVGVDEKPLARQQASGRHSSSDEGGDGASRDRVCIPITAFPVPGGQRSVLFGVEEAMSGVWQIEYLTQYVGPDAQGLMIHTFGNRLSTPWQYPNIRWYVSAGKRKILSLIRAGAAYQIILPQDGVYSGAFSAFAGKAAGIRVVCMDHGTITLPFNPTFRSERMAALAGRSLARQLASRARFRLYWPVLRHLARYTARNSDLFLVSGDDVEDTFVRLGVHPSQIIRYPYTIDARRVHPLNPEQRLRFRSRKHLPEDAVVISIAARLAPEKGIEDIALPALSKALGFLPSDLRDRVRIIIAGDGPTRASVEEGITTCGLEQNCEMWGSLEPDEVAALLGASDIFLYTSTRGAGLPMSVLEAMAAGCGVIAARQPESLVRVLADGRGIAIPSRDVEAVTEALIQLLADKDLRTQMGARARHYVAEQHSAAALRRCLLRATHWAPLAPVPAYAAACAAATAGRTSREESQL